MKKLILFISGFSVILPIASNAQTTSFTGQEICKAGIANVMGREVRIMKSSKRNDEIFVSYVRADDNKKFEYKCVLPPDSGTIIWATKIDGKWGRWRDTPADGDLTYKQVGDKLEINDTLSDIEIYNKSDF